MPSEHPIRSVVVANRNGVIQLNTDSRRPAQTPLSATVRKVACLDASRKPILPGGRH